tara:strand:+ start:447 stop:653 length:207 start_codon:yes stop_codon:yes gene_type:complete
MGRYNATLLKRVTIEKRSVNLYAGDWEIVERHEFEDEYGARNFVKAKIAEDPIPKRHLMWEVTRKIEC